MAHAANFKLALTRTIKPTAGPAVELATLEDAARFIADTYVNLSIHTRLSMFGHCHTSS